MYGGFYYGQSWLGGSGSQPDPDWCVEISLAPLQVANAQRGCSLAANGLTRGMAAAGVAAAIAAGVQVKIADLTTKASV